MSVLENNLFRHTLRILCALIIAFIVHYYFARMPGFWLPFATFFVMLTKVGNALFQSVVRFLILLIFFSIALLLLNHVSWGYFYDITLGAMIGIVVNTVILPDRIDIAFRSAMIPIIKSYKEYFSEIVRLILQMNLKQAEIAKAKMETHLKKCPGWVLATGFDKRLQKGHRYFLIKTLQMSEILYAMHHLARHSYEKQKIIKIRKPLLQCVKKVNYFFNGLTTVLDLKKLTQGIEDFSFEIKKIEKTFKKSVSLSTELLDIEKDDVYWVEFIYHLNDLHDAMVKLATALR